MNGKNFNSPLNKPVILVTPLDWGLGHATRCIPVIIKLLEYNCNVIIAAEGRCRVLLEMEFPGLTFLDLRGYRVQYSRTGGGLPLKMLSQLPKIIFRIYSEHAWLKKMIKKHAVDAVISDNRLGMYNKNIASIYITHQLQIKTGSQYTDRVAQKIHYWFINKFNECWVPDTGKEINLAGELSHPSKLPKIPVKYLGPLSRFKALPAGIQYDLLFILSGPEPQRTIFEDKILVALKEYKGRALLVRGLPDNVTIKRAGIPSLLEINDHLRSEELNTAILQSDLVITRSGYTAIMDLIKLKKRAVLVPTPGQTEQEYLAKYLMSNHFFYSAEQADFNLPDIIAAVNTFPFRNPVISLDDYEKNIDSFLKGIRSVQQ